MSAYLCSNFEISALACFIRQNGLHRPAADNTVTEKDIAKILYEANLKSVSDRYPNQKWPKFRFDSRGHIAGASPVQWIKAAKCLQYQSCEYPEYGDSAAYKMTQAVIDHNIGQLPGYEDAEWGLPEPKIVRVS